MKHATTGLLTLAFTLLSVSAVAYAKGKTTKETVVSGNTNRAYYLFVPERQGPAKPSPLLILFHGSNRDGMSLIEKWQDLAEKEGIILVGPNSSDPAYWAVGKDGPGLLNDLVESVKSKYSVDQRRVYLFGHSGGAGFALYMSLMESEYFAATAIHAGAIPKESYSVIEYAKRKIPMAIWVGDRDPLFPLETVRETQKVLVSNGFPVELNVVPNHDHWYYDLAPKINRNAWDFLKKQELSADPRYEQYKF